MQRFMLATIGVVVALVVGAPSLWAHDSDDLSRNHTRYGVSQFLAQNVSGLFQGAPLKLFNPNRVTHVTAMLFYTRPNDPPAEFVTCLVPPPLTPHASVQYNLDFLDVSRTYVELIAVPTETHHGGRLRDGLGINGTAAAQSDSATPLALLHPKLFSLPSDDDFAGQRQAAIDCICDGLDALAGVSNGVFEEFGIDCGGGDDDDDDDDDD